MSEAVARGSLVLSLDATQLNQGLSKAARDAKQKGKETGGNFSKATGDILKEKTGGDMGIMGMGMKAGLIGAGLAGVALIGKEIWDVITPVKQLEKDLEKAGDASKRWRETVQENINVEKEWIASLSSIAGTAEGMAQMQSRIGNIRGQVGLLDADLKNSAKAKDDLDSKWNSTDNFGTWLTGGLETKQKHAKEQYDQAKAAKEQAEKEQRDAQRALDRLKNPLTNPAAIAAHRDFIQGLRDATDEIEGQSAELSKLNALKRQYNLTSTQMAEAMRAIETKEAAQRTKDADELVKGLTADVMELAGVAKKTAEEEKLDELIKKGLQKEEVDRIKKLIEIKKQSAQEYKPLTALVKGTAAEIGFQNKTKFDEQKQKDLEKQLDELKKLTKIAAETRDATVKMERKDPSEIK